MIVQTGIMAHAHAVAAGSGGGVSLGYAPERQREQLCLRKQKEKKRERRWNFFTSLNFPKSPPAVSCIPARILGRLRSRRVDHGDETPSRGATSASRGERQPQSPPPLVCCRFVYVTALWLKGIQLPPAREVGSRGGEGGRRNNSGNVSVMQLASASVDFLLPL